MNPSPLRTSPLAAAPPDEPLRDQFLIALGYLLLGVLLTWPLVLNLNSGAIQRGTLPVDAGQGIWNLWWAQSALLRGADPYSTQHLFFPLEIDLFYQTVTLPNAILTLPIFMLWGPVAAFNSVVLLSFALGGLWAYRFCRALVDARWAALLGGFVFACGPYHMQRIWGGSLELIAVQWIPLYGLCLLRALHRRTLGSSVAAGAALLVTTLASQYYGLYCVIYTVAHVGLALLIGSRSLRWANLRSAVIIAATWLLGLLPFIWPLSSVGGATIADWYERQVYHAVALVDFVMPHILHPLWGAAALDLHNRFHPFGIETGAALGLGGYSLIGLALWRVGRSARPWLLLALMMALLSLGPELKLGEASTGIPLPFQLLDLVGPFRNSSRPSVFLAQMLLPVAILVALGAQSLRRMPLRAAFGALVLIEALVAPWAIMPMRADAAFAQLAADPQAGAVLELPSRNNDSQSLLNQICHGRPQLGGYLARLPGYPYARSASGLGLLFAAEQPNPRDILQLDVPRELASRGVRYVTLDLTQTPRSQAAFLRAQLADSAQIFADERREIYQITVQPAAQVGLGAGWFPPETDGERVWRWIEDRAELEIVSAERTPIQLRLRATAFAQNREVTIWLDETPIQQITIPAAPQDREILLNLIVNAGRTMISLRSPAERAPDGRKLALSVSDLAIRELPRTSAFAQQPLRLPMQFGGATHPICGGSQ